MGKSEREKLIDFINWYNNNPKEFSDNENVVDLYLDSQSPTEPEFDTLCEGDWAELDEEKLKYSLQLEGIIEQSGLENFIKMCIHGVVYSENELLVALKSTKLTQLTPEEFLRRAENTFKK